MSARIFTLSELRRYNGDDGPAYIAYAGYVYDVSECLRWQTGLHQQLHFAGQDLTGELASAPHTHSVFQHPCVHMVGRLQPAPSPFSD